MVIRKSHWQYLNELGFKPLLTCRKGDTLSSGGDTEYSYVLRLLGYTLWFDERLFFKHYMPAGRLSLDYIKRIRKAMSESNFVVSAYTDRLVNKQETQRSFHNKFKSQLRNYIITNIKKLFKGNFEEKEQAKDYFRNLNRLLFSFSTYQKNKSSINNWLTKHENKPEL
jgi:hypothetical protein